ncbi:MAG: hypothetical protein LBJ64_13395 [Deltaproteobacteria bacterium]|nr:hypothetical protein [Deltaproteobacteria bacterium]
MTKKAERTGKACFGLAKAGLVGFAALALASLFGCAAFGEIAPGGAPPRTEAASAAAVQVPADWPTKVYAALKAEYSDLPDLKVLFLASPREANLRYRYWTEKHFSGPMGLALMRTSRTGLLFGPSGPWFVLYVLGEDGQTVFMTDKLEWADVTEPLFAVETVDQTRVNTTTIIRPLGLSPQGSQAMRLFSVRPFDEIEEDFAETK